MVYTLHRADSNPFIVNRDTIILEWAGKFRTPSSDYLCCNYFIHPDFYDIKVATPADHE